MHVRLRRDVTVGAIESPWWIPKRRNRFTRLEGLRKEGFDLGVHGVNPADEIFVEVVGELDLPGTAYFFVR